MATDLDACLPATVTVTFPAVDEDVGGNRTPRAAPYAVTAANPYGSGFSGTKVLHSTCLAVYDHLGALTNGGELSALAAKMGADWFAYAVGRSNVTLSGAREWSPEGLTDRVEWVHTHDRIVTEAVRGPWIDHLDRLEASGSEGSFTGDVFVNQTFVLSNCTIYSTGDTWYLNNDEWNFNSTTTVTFTGTTLVFAGPTVNFTVNQTWTISNLAVWTITGYQIDIDVTTVNVTNTWNYTSFTANYYTSVVNYYDTTVNNYYDTTVVNYYESTTVNFYDTTVVNFVSTTINFQAVTVNFTASQTWTIANLTVWTLTGYQWDIDVTTVNITTGTWEWDSTTSVTFQGSVEICGVLLWCYETLALVSASTNDLSQTTDKKVVYRMTASADAAITGLVTAGLTQVLCLHNASAYFVTLKHEDTNSAAGNRFWLPAARDFPLASGESCMLWYDPVRSRWVVLADSSRVYPGDQNQLLSVDPDGNLSWQGQTAGTQTADFTVGTDAHLALYPVDATGGNITVTLPSVAGAADFFQVWFRRVDNTSNTVTIQRAGADTIEGGTSIRLGPQHAVYCLFCDGTQWLALTKTVRGTTKGDLAVYNGYFWERLGVGTDTHVLTADSGQALGVKWAAASGGTSPTSTSGSAVLGGAYNVPSSTWASTGLSVTLPAAGTYLVVANASGRANVSAIVGSALAYIQVRLYNQTAGAAVSDTEAIVTQVLTTSTTRWGSCGVTALVTTSGSEVVRLEAMRQDSGVTWNTAEVYGNGAPGRTRLTYVQLA